MNVDQRRIALVAAGAAGVLVVAVMVSIGLSSTNSSSTGSNPRHQSNERGGQPAGALQLPRQHGPLLLGAPVTLEGAESLAGGHLPRPNTPVANDSSVRGVFYEQERFDDGRPPSYQIALDYDAGVIVFVHPAADDSFDDPATEYAQMANGLNKSIGSSIASVKTIQGLPALVIQHSGTGVSSVDFVLPSGLRVQLIAVYAPTMDVATVEAIAQSIA